MKIISFFLAIALSLLSLFSCSDGDQGGEKPPAGPSEEEKIDWCVYKTERNITDHDICTVKITVKDYGEIVVLLDATTAPATVENFKKLVSEGFYNGLTFHRIIENFMIQGGDPNGDGTGGSSETIKGEFSKNGHSNDIKHLRGVISMARSGSSNETLDKKYYDSASSQFFICNADSTSLDGSYAAFGYVISGMSVVDKITEIAVNYCTDDVIEYKALQPKIEKIEII